MTAPEVEAAKALLKKGRSSDAIRILQQAEARNPKDPEVLMELAGIYSLLEMPAMAVEYERRATKVDASLPEVWNAMGADLHRMGDLTRSAGAYRRALELDPKLATAAYNLARVAAQRGERKEASDALKHAITLRPDLAEDARREESLAKLLDDVGFRKRPEPRRKS
ncbi:MAG TPA: tetratricopeptide repeat protein [Thermoplasmata archaeon]|nr:tetratricopeptide repeat protein [Thermoplasmata archaeon]